MLTEHSYTVVLRADSRIDPVVTRTVRARDGNQAQGEAMALAAKVSAERGQEYRVARVDPA